MIMIIVSPVFLWKSIRIAALFGNMVKYRDCHVEILVMSLFRSLRKSRHENELEIKSASIL